MAKKILLVDDDVEDREIIRDALGDLGYHSVIHFEENGENALSFLESAYNEGRMPSMVILDLNMPRMNGTQTLRHLKRDERFKDFRLSSTLLLSIILNAMNVWRLARIRTSSSQCRIATP